MLRSVKYGLGGAVLASLVSGTVAYATAGQPVAPITVALVVDGAPQNVKTTGRDVAAVLAEAGYTVGPHDLLAPSSATAVADNSKIVLNRGRLLHLVIDGKKRDVWTTATTVDAALDQLGVSSQTYVSVSRSKRLPLDATALDLRSPKRVVVVDGTAQHPLVSTGDTVQDVLTETGVKLDADDRVSPALTSPLADGQTITVTRVRVAQVVEKRATGFDVVSTPTGTLYVGKTRVVEPGEKGLVKIVFRVTYLNGKQAEKVEVRRVVVSEPVDRQELTGTKRRPAPEPTTDSSDPSPASESSGPAPAGLNASPSEAKAIAKALVSRRSWSSSQYQCLVSLWNRESGWRVHAANGSGAYGIPQALPGSKMGSSGSDWQDNATTQIKWGLGYIANRYGTPCGAWNHSENYGWY